MLVRRVKETDAGGVPPFRAVRSTDQLHRGRIGYHRITGDVLNESVSIGRDAAEWIGDKIGRVGRIGWIEDPLRNSNELIECLCPLINSLLVKHDKKRFSECDEGRIGCEEQNVGGVGTADIEPYITDLRRSRDVQS